MSTSHDAFRADDCTVLIEPLAPNDGGGFVATVLDLPGCIAHGETRAEAAANAEDAITDWLDAAEANGEVPPTTIRACGEALNMSEMWQTWRRARGVIRQRHSSLRNRAASRDGPEMSP